VKSHGKGTEYFYVLTLKDTTPTGLTRTSTSSGIWSAARGAKRSEAYAEIRQYVIAENGLNSEPATTFFSLEKNDL
jgi:hypothetical protein